jgi:predicted ATPase/DNA-binding SARP family transcriptional activator
MEIRILGPLEVADGNRLAPLGGAKQRSLLAVLVLHLNEVVTTDRLIDEVWADTAPATATKSVQVYVSALRRSLPAPDPVLLTRSGGYVLRLDPAAVDARRFEDAVEAGRRAIDDDRPEEAADVLRAGLALWRGPPLVDFTYQPFAHAEIARLEELRLTALETRIDADLRLGRHATPTSELEALVAEYPARERLTGQLMIALYRGGRQADALDVYQRTRTYLDEQLGLVPGPALQALQFDILRQALPQDATAPRPRPVLVPPPRTPTVGRDGDLAKLRALLADPGTRWLTMVGPGGVGKTRVALELAQRPGAAFVSLAPVAAAEHVPAAIAQTLHLPSASDVPVQQTLARHLADADLLLVLDNCEHVIDAAAGIADLLDIAPGLTVLATSREPLRVRPERTFSLAPLELPAADDDDRSSAMELFLQVARGHDPVFAPEPDELAAIAGLCRRLDGLPLAIELAAGRLGLLSPLELARDLDAGIDALGLAPSDAPRRQRTLRATLNWSHDLLDAEEQAAFAALSIFAGGADLAAAQQVVTEREDVLEALVGKQLVILARTTAGGRRLGMLETVRAFARERLAARHDRDAIARRHAEHYLDVAETVAAELHRSNSPRAAARLEPEIDNVRSALGWALAQPDSELAARLAVALDHYLALVRPMEGERWLDAALATDADLDPAIRSRALHRRAFQLNLRSQFERAEAAAREGYALSATLDDARGRADALTDLAYTRIGALRRGEAMEIADDAIDWARRAGDETALADALAVKAGAATTLDVAVEAADEAISLYSRAENHFQLMVLPMHISYRALYDGDDAVAERALRQARAAARAAGPPGKLRLPYVDGTEGLLALFRDDRPRAARAFRDQVTRGRRAGDDRCVCEGLAGLAALAARGEPETAALLDGAGEALRQDRLGGAAVFEGPIEHRVRAILEEARDRFGAEHWHGAAAAGAHLAADDAVDLALSTAGRLVT